MQDQLNPGLALIVTNSKYQKYCVFQTENVKKHNFFTIGSCRNPYRPYPKPYSHMVIWLYFGHMLSGMDNMGVYQESDTIVAI